jgi:hypothetical protein
MRCSYCGSRLRTERNCPKTWFRPSALLAKRTGLTWQVSSMLVTMDMPVYGFSILTRGVVRWPSLVPSTHGAT